MQLPGFIADRLRSALVLLTALAAVAAMLVAIQISPADASATGPDAVRHANRGGPVVWSHRGASKNAPEETTAAYGYTLREFGNALLRVGDGAVIEPGSLYKVYVGPGTDRPHAHFNGLTAGVLANTVTDHVYLYDAGRVMQDLYSYIAS
ncbi:hypothetical protein GCM10022419_095680 [Nonomuraea rosea]|uniref:Uncharacterized protein n=1 Tax=Nonomuraea rosea TaxID=638574 RepID=A0ABP6Z4N3_9ACTN